MTAIMTALVSYLGTDLLMAALSRAGIVGTRAAVLSRATKRLAPVAVRILARLRDRRNQLEVDCRERQEIDEEIDALSAAQESLTNGWFR